MTSRTRRVAILTGGGDVPGLNAAIKSFVWRMEEEGYEVIGLRRGWEALLHIVPDPSADNSDWITPLSRSSTRTIDRTGGTFLHTSRTNPEILKPAQVPDRLRDRVVALDERGRADLTAVALETIAFLGIEALAAVGGDGTLTFARRLHREGVPLVAMPKTMDNDVYGTDYCIGFSTAITRAVRFINDLRTAAGSHERILIVELFGRNSGETCLLSSYLASTDRAVIAEVPFDRDRLYELLAEDRSRNPSNYSVLAISEGASPIGGSTIASGEGDAAGNRRLGGIGALLRDHIEQKSRDKVIYQQLGYLMRSGAPDSLDHLVANNIGTIAADLIRRGETGSMVAILGGRYTTIPIEQTGEGIKRVDVDRFYDTVGYRPKVREVLGLPMFLH